MSPTSSEDKPFIGGRLSKIKKKKSLLQRNKEVLLFLCYAVGWKWGWGQSEETSTQSLSGN